MGTGSGRSNRNEAAANGEGVGLVRQQQLQWLLHGHAALTVAHARLTCRPVSFVSAARTQWDQRSGQQALRARDDPGVFFLTWHDQEVHADGQCETAQPSVGCRPEPAGNPRRVQDAPVRPVVVSMPCMILPTVLPPTERAQDTPSSERGFRAPQDVHGLVETAINWAAAELVSLLERSPPAAADLPCTADLHGATALRTDFSQALMSLMTSCGRLAHAVAMGALERLRWISSRIQSRTHARIYRIYTPDTSSIYRIYPARTIHHREGLDKPRP